MASFDYLNSALLVLAIYTLQRAAGAPYHPTLLVELETIVDHELSRILSTSVGLQRQTRVLADRLTRGGIATSAEDLIQGLIVKFLARRRAGDLPLYVSYRYFELQLLQEFSAIHRRHQPLYPGDGDAPLLDPDPLSEPGLVGDPSSDALGGFFTSTSAVDLEICLMAVDSLLRVESSNWITEAASQLGVPEDEVRDVLRKFASQLAKKLRLSEKDAAFLERLLLWEERTRGWKGRLAEELGISKSSFTQKLKIVRRAFARAAGLDPKSRRGDPARRRATAETASSGEGGPADPKKKAAGKLALFPDELLCMLRYVLGGDSAALGLLSQVRGLGSVREVHDLLATEELPAVARRVSTRWAHLTAWCDRARRQYRQLSVAPPDWLDDELAHWAPRGTRRWIPELRRLATLNREYGDVAAALKTSPLQITAAMNQFADLADARLFYEQIRSGATKIDASGQTFGLVTAAGNGHVTPSCLRHNLKLVRCVVDAANHKLVFSALSIHFGSRLAIVRALTALRDYTTTGGTCSCERRFHLCLH